MPSDDFYAERRRMTFEQAEGVEPLPSQLQLKEISPELSARLFDLIHSEYSRSSKYFEGGFSGSVRLIDPWKTVLRRNHIERNHQASDEFTDDFNINLSHIKKIMFRRNYTEIFGFLQFALRTRRLFPTFPVELQRVLSASRAAYIVVEDDTIVPISSEAEARALIEALTDLSSSGLAGAKAHLKEAASKLTSGEFSSSVRESINSV